MSIIFSVIRKIGYIKFAWYTHCYWFAIVSKIFNIFNISETMNNLRLFAFSLH